MDPDVQRTGPRGTDLRSHRRTAPPFAKIGKFVGELIASATEAAARAWGKAKGPEAQAATPMAQVESGSTVQQVTEEQAAMPAAGDVGAEPRPVELVEQQRLGGAIAAEAPANASETSQATPTVEPVEQQRLMANAPAKGSETRRAEEPVDGGRPAWKRWTTPTIRTRIEKAFGVDVCKETVRRVLHKLGLSWKKAKKLLAKADPDKRRAFVADIRALLDRVTHDESLVLAYIDEAHIHQDADMGYGWSLLGDRLYVASSSPGLKAKVSFYGIYLYSESRVLIWDYPRANGEHTIDVLERLRRELPERPMVVVWDGASYHRSACVLEAARRLGIQIVRLPAYSPDFMPVEALWRWLRESVTYNHCHDSAAELVERVAAFVAEINRDACALADRLWVKDELDPEEEKLRFSA